MPYTVTNTTYNITSTAFIQVPAYGVFPPTLRPSAGIEGERTRDDHHQYRRLCARGRRQDRVCGRRRFGERHEGRGRRPVCERPDVEVHRIKGLFRSSSITFTAVDGKRDKNDNVKIINSAVLTLPITVIGRDMPAPTFSSSTIDVVAGESATTIDLTALTHSASDLYDDEKQYTYSGGTDSDQVSAKVSSNGKLTVSADKTASPGTTVSVPISIQYSKGTVSAGVTVRVTAPTGLWHASTRKP